MGNKAILYGGFHGNLAGDFNQRLDKELNAAQPKAIEVESWDGTKWVRTRQAWDEAQQRYVRAEGTK